MAVRLQRGFGMREHGKPHAFDFCQGLINRRPGNRERDIVLLAQNDCDQRRNLSDRGERRPRVGFCLRRRCRFSIDANASSFDSASSALILWVGSPPLAIRERMRRASRSSTWAACPCPSASANASRSPTARERKALEPPAVVRPPHLGSRPAALPMCECSRDKSRMRNAPAARWPAPW